MTCNKRFMLRPIALIFMALMAIGPVAAQVGSGTLKGKIMDLDADSPLPFASVVLFLNGNQVSGTNTDFDGEYTIKPVQPGTYEVLVSFVGYQSQKITGVKITANKIQFVNAALSAGVMMEEAEVVEYTVPLIDKDGGASGGTMTREDIDKMPGRSAASIATTVAGASTAGTGGGISIRGARPSSTWVYIDGIKVRGSSALPKSAIEEVQVVTGGIPANIGDATGGVINISLRNSSSKWFGGGEVITSGLPTEEGAIGFDDFGYNVFEGSISGPIAFAKDEEGNNLRPLLGLFLSGNYTYQKDPRPTFDGNYRMTDEARAAIFENPLRQNISSTGEVNGALYEADFLTASDFIRTPTRLNAANQNASLVAKIDVNTDEYTSLTFGATGYYSQGASYSYANSLMNWENNLDVTSYDWRAYAKFSQRFAEAEDESTTSTLKNVFYQVMADYSQSFQRVQDASHGDNFFRYGHVGKFDVYKRNSYGYDPFGARFRHNGWEDTLVTFEASPHNPELAAINNQYFSLFEQEAYNPNVDGPYESLLEVQNGNALLNGQGPAATYGLWSYYGAQGNSYSTTNNTQFRISAAGSGDIGDHALQLGFEYEQRRDAFFSLSPSGLWTLGRLTTNSHIKELNLNDSTITNQGSAFYVTYGRLIGDNQFEFDRNLRTSLGLDPDGNDYVNLDAIDPDALTLDMFGADDLLNQGNNVVNYSGYDPYGNKVTRRPTLEDFFNEKNEAGYFTRPIQAYEPIYISGYVMDKFTFDDIIFNVGVRVDRFDANQQVLQDPYVIGENYKVGDLSGDLINQLEDGTTIPGNIGDDFAVYVDALEGPTSIVGYRDGDTWFNASGTEINDPDILAVNEVYPAPWLVEGPDAELTSKAFKDYEPQVNIMPRVAFSFNISDEAVFFAHYDILTQRPTSNNRFSPIDYFFIESRDNLISNPDLRPEKTIDYELGFQQVLTKTSSLKISAFYKEMRDMIQVRNFTGAYPRPYKAYGNLDFGTVKGLTIGYDLRRTGNIRMNTSYTLQFADGTGSTTTTALALINAGLPNLRSINPFNYDQRHRIVTNIDFRYGSGNDYNGPVINLGKNADGSAKQIQLFANAGINMIANLGSGTPYTASTIATPITGEISPSTEGSINGSRLPWQFNMDANIDKNWTITKGEGDDAHSYNVNVYFWIGNLLNTRNINSVYRFTGISEDDGYLAAAQYQPLINSQNDPNAFRNYYGMYVNNPFNLGVPRTIRLGVKFDF
ncbi:MAG: carboxypeptidase regulatory-like domain-containing protein [Flavobacteriales bacterium]|nr:carboxypeptidase regulatory-like domain-containing protein [Flavobacteriales bacterium]